MLTGKLFEIKRFAVHDGPGIRTIFFFKGCPLRCLWCHNPEGIDYGPEIALLERKCAGCGECTAACSLGLHIFKDNKHNINRKNCISCFNCVNACMPEALMLYGREYTADELMQIVNEDIDFYRQSGGGVTCSGGEPLMQADFLAVFLSMCKKAGLHTAIDTSGCAGWSEFMKILPFTDLFLYDIKHMDPVQHKKHTGVDNGLILENLRKLSDSGKAIEIRIPVIPVYNDDAGNIQKTAEFLKEIKTITLIRPLPYHALSGSKYLSIGKTHTMPVTTGDEYTATQQVCDTLTSLLPFPVATNSL